MFRMIQIVCNILYITNSTLHNVLLYVAFGEFLNLRTVKATIGFGSKVKWVLLTGLALENINYLQFKHASLYKQGSESENEKQPSLQVYFF